MPLLGILLIGTALRFYRLTGQSLWYDEGFSIYLARLSLRQAVALTAQDVHPPLYYLLLHFWIRICGDSAFAVRAFSVFGGIASIALAYRLGKDLWNVRSGLLTAFFLTISPLFLYYAQETRMYSLLTALSLACSCLLLRITKAPDAVDGKRFLLWDVYLLLGLAGAYMHYFFLLLLAGHALYIALRWWTSGRPILFAGQAAMSFVVGLVSYLPWVPVIVDRYRHDTGYLEGSMAIAKSLQYVLSGFSVGPILQGKFAWQITLGHLAVLLLAGLGFLLSRRSRGVTPTITHQLAFLGIYLGVPLLLIVLLYQQKARVNPHHSMLIAPAFWCLLAVSVSSLWDRASELRHPAGRWASRELALAAAAFVIAASLYIDWNYYFNGEYSRPDFRNAVRFICENRKADEAVILVSGHMFPIYDYYCPGTDRYLVPDTLVLRVDQRVSFEVMETLQRAAQGKSGIWVMLWQNYFVDPHDIVGWLIAEQSREPPYEAYFHKIWVRHYLLKPEAQFVWGEDVVFPAQARWGNGISLLEARANKTSFRAGESLQLTLYWRTEKPIARSYDVFTHVIDATDIILAQHDGVPGGAKRPTTSWQPGEVIVDRHQIEVKSTIPPGEYRIEVGLYEPHVAGMPRLPVVNEAGQEVETRVILGTIRVE